MGLPSLVVGGCGSESRAETMGAKAARPAVKRANAEKASDIAMNILSQSVENVETLKMYGRLEFLDKMKWCRE